MLRFKMAAVDEAEAVVDWLAQHHPSKVAVFIDALENAFKEIEETPHRFSRLETVLAVLPERDIRRCNLAPLPYFVVYEVRKDHELIVAVAHPSRKPNYWLERLD